MSKPLVVSIPHRLGKDEALRRIRTGLGAVRQNYAQLITVDEEVWTGDYIFENEWQTFRTKKDRSLELRSVAKECEPGDRATLT